MFSCEKIFFFSITASFGNLCNENRAFLHENPVFLLFPATEPQKCPNQCLSLHYDSMQKAFHGDAAAVAFTHAPLWFLGKQMGEIQTVYHDRLQMSFCGQCTLLWKWFGQWKREEKYNMDKKRKWESFWVCLSRSRSFSVQRWSVIDVMEIDFQVNYFPCPSVSGRQ